MKILLDTHIMLWAIADDEQLPGKAMKLIEDKENDIYISIISLWEVQIKHILHPDQLERANEVSRYCRISGFEMLPLSEKAIDLLPKLERPKSAPRHKDPFDRVLICQAMSEDMVFLTHDTLLPDYGIENVMYV